MQTHNELIKQALQNSAVKQELERLEREEMPILDAILQARIEAGLTQAEVAKRMNTKPPAIARLENSLLSGKHSPSIATLSRYAQALGKRLEVRVI